MPITLATKRGMVVTSKTSRQLENSAIDTSEHVLPRAKLRQSHSGMKVPEVSPISCNLCRVKLRLFDPRFGFYSVHMICHKWRQVMGNVFSFILVGYIFESVSWTGTEPLMHSHKWQSMFVINCRKQLLIMNSILNEVEIEKALKPSKEFPKDNLREHEICRKTAENPTAGGW